MLTSNGIAKSILIYFIMVFLLFSNNMNITIERVLVLLNPN